MKTSPVTLAVLALAVLSGACGWQDYLAVELSADVEEVCVVDLPAEFAPGGGIAIIGAVTRDELGLDLFESETTDLSLLSVGVVAVDGIDDFSFVDGLRVRLGSSDPDTALPMVPVLELGATEMTMGGEFFTQLDDAIDVEPYLAEGALALEVEFSGQLPADAWTVAVDTCFRAKVAYRKPLLGD